MLLGDPHCPLLARPDAPVVDNPFSGISRQRGLSVVRRSSVRALWTGIGLPGCTPQPRPDWDPQERNEGSMTHTVLQRLSDDISQCSPSDRQVLYSAEFKPLQSAVPPDRAVYSVRSARSWPRSESGPDPSCRAISWASSRANRARSGSPASRSTCARRTSRRPSS